MLAEYPAGSQGDILLFSKSLECHLILRKKQNVPLILLIRKQ
jgi:hypothetical protein